jgi:hypothetical protein
MLWASNVLGLQAVSIAYSRGVGRGVGVPAKCSLCGDGRRTPSAAREGLRRVVVGGAVSVQEWRGGARGGVTFVGAAPGRRGRALGIEGRCREARAGSGPAGSVRSLDGAGGVDVTALKLAATGAGNVDGDGDGNGDAVHRKL